MTKNQSGQGNSITPEIHGRILSPKEMLAVGVAATALATGAANYFDGEDGRARLPAIDVEWSDPAFGDSANDLKSGFTFAGGNGDQISVQDGREGEESQELSSTMDEEWARNFAQDEQAGRLINPEEIDHFAEALQEELQDGWSIDSISIRGTTSAEDDSVDENGNRTAGLQETTQSAEQHQEELGDARRELGALQLAIALEERGISIDTSVVDRMPSIEDVLTDKETSKLEALASDKQFGYDSVTDMIERWNRDPDSAPPAVDDALMDLLAQERTFQVEVGMSREAQDSSGTLIPGEKPDASGDINGALPIEKDDHKLRLLPIVIPGYFFITLGRRKAQGERTPTVNTIPPAGARPLPLVPIDRTGPFEPLPVPGKNRGNGRNGNGRQGGKGGQGSRRFIPIKPPHYKGRTDQDEDSYRSDLDWKRIRGQKPVRHRGRTHMTGPRW